MTKIDYACINGELIKCTTTTYNKCYEKYFIGTNKKSYYKKLGEYTKRNAFSNYIKEVKIWINQELKEEATQLRKNK